MINRTDLEKRMSQVDTSILLKLNALDGPLLFEIVLVIFSIKAYTQIRNTIPPVYFVISTFIMC